MFNKYRTVICEDGFHMSVQASAVSYCSPRIEGAKQYTEVEIGYPSGEEPLIMRYAEDPSKPTTTVYGYVPVNIVYLVIIKHGGMVAGQVPNGVPVYEHYKL